MNYSAASCEVSKMSFRLVRNLSLLYCIAVYNVCSGRILAPASRSRTQAGSLRRRGDPTSGNDRIRRTVTPKLSFEALFD
jgi:hypothetical protein